MMRASNEGIIEDILKWLGDRLEEDPSLLETSRVEQKLITLKELSRVKADAGSIYTSRGIKILLQYGCRDGAVSISREAKRCLANALTLEDQCVPLFLQAGGLESLLEKGSKTEALAAHEEEFLMSRIMFLVTAKTGPSIGHDLQSNHDIWVSVLGTWLSQHLIWVSDCALSDESVASVMSPRISSLCETLKFLYNLSLYAPSILDDCRCQDNLSVGYCNLTEITLRFIHSLNETKDSLLKVALPLSINVLTNIEIRNTPEKRLISLYSVLEQFVDAILENTHWHGISISEAQLAPLVTVLARFHNIYADNPDAQNDMASHLLVSDTERSSPLGRTNSVPSKLLRLLNSPSEVTRECIGALLYQVSGSSAQKFVENVGYGYGIGFLTAHGIAIPQNEISDSHNGTSINPITGQNLKDEMADLSQEQLRDMTDEEKEREAEKLFVLFQRMKKNGIINVKDPIEEAISEGRFQEL